MSKNIEGKVVVITGASSGLGESTARHLADLGATVVLGARRKDRLDAIVKDITAKGGKALAVTVDVTKVTCDQWVHGKMGEPRNVAIWFSGYYDGKRELRTYDPQAFDEDINKMQNFCYQEQNFKMPLMEAVEKVFGARK